jgi:hypothetical protein
MFESSYIDIIDFWFEKIIKELMNIVMIKLV